MTCEHIGPRPINYMACRYGASRIQFRGPKADLTKPYVLYLGGTETYGKFIATPFPQVIGQRFGLEAANLGVCNAGPDLYLNDPGLTDLSHRALATVIQLPGIQNLSNRYYSVHPRRNDRFVQAATLLQTIYRDVDFPEFHFTGHLMQHLHRLDLVRFNILRVELQQAWIARMKTLIASLTGPVVLLNLADGPCPDTIGVGATDEMLEALRSHAQACVSVELSDAARQEGTARMVHAPMEKAAARLQLSQRGHEDIADALAPALSPMIPHPDHPIAAE